MTDAVRPGGWLLIEEDDWGSMWSASITDPSVASFIAAFRSIYDAFRKKGIVYYYFGRRVRGLVEELGLVDVGRGILDDESRGKLRALSLTDRMGYVTS